VVRYEGLTATRSRERSKELPGLPSLRLDVWVNLSSKVYHYRGYKDYGTTKKGAYMCEKDATAQGNRASKIEKHPS
jgi:hypothetical protein